MLYSVEAISQSICNVLMSKGVTKKDAICIAEILLEADLRGYKSQGMQRLFQILDGFNQQTITPFDNSEMIKDFNAVTIFNGKGYLGQPLAKKAMNVAMEKSKIYGIGISGVINAGHIGLLAYYSELAAKEDCIGIVMTTTSPAVVIKSSNSKLLGTNPISFSVPSKHSQGITSDFSTSRVSRGKIFEYLKENKPIPKGWALNSEGKDTTSAQEALEGGIQTFDSDIKGASISLLISILSGPLIGGVKNSEVKGTRFMNESPNKGDLFLCFDIAQFTDTSTFLETIEGIIGEIRQECTEYHVPGSHSHERKKNSLKKGLEIPSELRELFDKCNQELCYVD